MTDFDTAYWASLFADDPGEDPDDEPGWCDASSTAGHDGSRKAEPTMGDVNDAYTRAALGNDSRGQLRFARLLAHDYRDRLLHVHGLGWHYWDGARWAVDEGEIETRNAALAVVTGEWGNALADPELLRDVKKCQSAAGINGILDIARVLDGLTAHVADLDADPYMLNVANGTLNLKTGELRPHNPADRITKVCRAAYHKGRRSDMWDGFLERVLPHKTVRAYLARFTGTALIGKVIEHSFTIGTGEGANGKGTLYKALLWTLGDYGHPIDSDVLTASRHTDGERPKPALVKLRGRRLVVTSETEREITLAAALVKKLTGGDPIPARALYRDPIEFEPSHSLFMVTNHLPKLPGNDPAVWRRVRVVPFDVVIPEEERDGQLDEKLQLHAEAILNWAVEGLADYWQNGMNPPEEVLQATAAYQQRSDAVQRFLSERVIVNPHMNVSVAELWKAWTDWARDDGADEVSKREFNEELGRRGHQIKTARINGSPTRAWRGLGLYVVEEEAA